MHLVVIAWLYVALMMSVAEATNTTGTVLGAIITFLLYGLGPVALVIYLMGSPARRKAIKAREKAELESLRATAGTANLAGTAQAASGRQPDDDAHAPAAGYNSVASRGNEP